MQNSKTVTAFAGEKRLAMGSPIEVARAIQAACPGGAAGTILVFDNETGAQVDLDLRTVEPEPSAASPRGDEGEARRAGRPKLGVVAREVTLLPRHWEWLAGQPGGASVTLRKLVDAARKADIDKGAGRRAARGGRSLHGGNAGQRAALRGGVARPVPG